MKTTCLFVLFIALSNSLNGQKASSSCEPKLSLPCKQTEGVTCKTFTHKGFTYNIFRYSCGELKHATVQRGKNGHWETIYDTENWRGFELRDINSDNWVDIEVQDRAIRVVSLFNPLTGRYIDTGEFGEEIGFCHPQWRVNDYFITRFEDRFDVWRYNLYKMVNYKQITVGQIDFHVLNTQNDSLFITGIEIFKVQNGDLKKTKLVKTIAFDKVEARFFTKNRFLKDYYRNFPTDFKQDDFARYYFTKHFKEFMAN